MDNIVCYFQGERKIARANESEAGGFSAAAPEGSERGRSPLPGRAGSAPLPAGAVRCGRGWELAGEARTEPGCPRHGESQLSAPRRAVSVCGFPGLALGCFAGGAN